MTETADHLDSLQYSLQHWSIYLQPSGTEYLTIIFEAGIMKHLLTLFWQSLAVGYPVSICPFWTAFHLQMKLSYFLPSDWLTTTEVTPHGGIDTHSQEGREGTLP